MTGTIFDLYRLTHPDGSAKDWAYAETSTGLYEVRWGKQGRLVQRQVDLRLATVRKREVEKLNKGYRYLGRFLIDSGGTVGPRPGPPQPTPAPRPAPPPRPQPQPKKTPVDLAALLGGAEDGFYF